MEPFFNSSELNACLWQFVDVVNVSLTVNTAFGHFEYNVL